MKKKIFIIAAVAVITVAAATIFVLTGRNNKPATKNDSGNKNTPSQTENAQKVDTDENKNPYFDATVSEVKADSIVLTPLSGQEAVKGFDKVEIPSTLYDSTKMPDLSKGNVIRVIFNGQIGKSSPGKINTVFKVYLIDNSGNPII